MRKALTLISLLLTGGAASAYEEPSYEVVETRESYEIRRYDSYLVAETVVAGGFDAAGNQAFRRLFGYITGNNLRAGSDASEKIKMTIPVVTTMPADATEATASYTYYFVMPSSYTVEDLPHPTDAQITIRRVPEHHVAVLRYSGRSNENNFRSNEKLLLDALKKDGVELRGEPCLAVYNGPFTPWFLRRNEVLVEIVR